MKEYFSHDYNARNDRKLTKLKVCHKMTGLGVYWSIIEMLYEENGKILLGDILMISDELRTDPEVVESVIKDFDLFEKDRKYFWSDSVLKRLKIRDEKSDQARKAGLESARKRALKLQEATISTDVERNLNDRSTIKEKNSKVNKKDNTNSIVVRKRSFAQSLTPFVEKYGKETVREFYEYWTEPNKSGTKFKQELQTTWDTSRRLETWAKNDFSRKIIPITKGAVDQSQNTQLFS